MNVANMTRKTLIEKIEKLEEENERLKNQNRTHQDAYNKLSEKHEKLAERHKDMKTNLLNENTRLKKKEFNQNEKVSEIEKELQHEKERNLRLRKAINSLNLVVFDGGE